MQRKRFVSEILFPFLFVCSFFKSTVVCKYLAYISKIDDFASFLYYACYNLATYSHNRDQNVLVLSHPNPQMTVTSWLPCLRPFKLYFRLVTKWDILLYTMALFPHHPKAMLEVTFWSQCVLATFRWRHYLGHPS